MAATKMRQQAAFKIKPSLYPVFNMVNNRHISLILLSALLYSQAGAASDAIEPLKARYQKLGALPFDVARGRQLWNRKVLHNRSGKMRSCSNCHGTTFTKPGRHIRTRKVIKPLSVAIEPNRFNSMKKVEKWFKRNCKWTFSRPCSPQEKGDILTFIQFETWRK